MSLLLIFNNKEEYILIPNEAIRVRVIANSNNEEDIQVKERLKDKLNKELQDILKNITNINEARKKISSSLDFINNFVDKSLKELNYDKKYSINYGLNYFPEKVFKGLVYSEGLYESLVVTLGEGKGPNYWCVLYPPLCLIDSNNEENDYRFFIKEIIDKYL